ncbi:MAG: ketopantoate reductase family protein [Pseudomonadota bacterium]
MKILVLGAGAVGGYFGGMMRAAGLNTGFVVRGPRAAQLRKHGLAVISPDSEMQVDDLPVHVAGEALPDADIILMAIKATGLTSAIASLKSAVGKDTLIVPLLNGLRHIETLADAFGDERVAGGLCYIQASLDDNGAVRRHGPHQRIVVGARRPSQEEGLKAFVDYVAPAGFDAVCSANVEQAMWDKMVFLATLAGVTSIARGAVGDIIATPYGEEAMRAMLDECLAIAEAEGFALSPAAIENAQKLLLDPASRLSSSMLGDIRAGKPTEGDHILGDLIKRGEKHKIATPFLKAAHVAVLVHEGQLAH